MVPQGGEWVGRCNQCGHDTEPSPKWGTARATWNRQTYAERLAAFRVKHREQYKRWIRLPGNSEKKSRKDLERNRLNPAARRKSNLEHYHRQTVEQRRSAWRRWADKYPEKVRERAHRRYARKVGATVERIPSEVLTAIMAAPCTYCGAPGPGTIDHIVPLKRGGAHAASNLTSACFPCNSSKGTKTVEEFLAWRKLRATYNIPARKLA